MRELLFAFVVACNGEAGADCPMVPQPGQTCKKEGAVCIYQAVGTCVQTQEYRCTGGRFAPVVLPGCDASTDAAKDAPADGPIDAPVDAPKDSSQDAPSD